MPFKDKDKAQAWSKAHHKIYYPAYYEANKERLRFKSRRWYHANRERGMADAKAWKEANPDRVAYHIRKYNLSKYGVTPELYAAQLAWQGGVCAICGEPPPAGKNLDVDHSGDGLRGLLCNPCNRGVAAFRDDPARLAAAIRYLKARAR